MSHPRDHKEGCFALLDDCESSAEARTSRLYTSLVRERSCADPDTFEHDWTAVEDDLRAGLHAVVLIDYEWGRRMARVAARRQSVDDAGAARFLMFERMERLSLAQVDEWLALRDENIEPSCAGVMNLAPLVEREEYDAAIARIHEWIDAGDTYQVNYTYRLRGQAFGSPLALYRRLRERQKVSFGALIALPPGGDHEFVLSCSPELFVRHRLGRISARPMKGTAPRSGVPEADRRNVRWLAQDEKNRAENLMIVDLLRNDLGRIARIGSVQVPALFSVESYGTVYQMTSSVEADLPPDTSFPAVLRALFPCGSITGAPKYHTMELIARLESSPRGLYTGAIGWIDAPASEAADVAEAERRCGDFCLSVAIRTLTLGRQVEGLRPVLLGAGGGVVHDSTADEEYSESRLKVRFVSEMDPGFTLFETLRGGRSGVAHLDTHLARLGRSARQLGFAYSEAKVRAMLEAQCSSLPAGPDYRLRLDLRHDGDVHIETAPIAVSSSQLVILGLSNAVLSEAEAALVQHKTSMRRTYDKAIKDAERLGVFDLLFFNDRDQLTEGARCNVFVRIGGRWWTPPLACGVLPGIMRGEILADSTWNASERVLTRIDLEHADEILVCNALRGVLKARLLGAGPRAAITPESRAVAGSSNRYLLR